MILLQLSQNHRKPNYLTFYIKLLLFPKAFLKKDLIVLLQFLLQFFYFVLKLLFVAIVICRAKNYCLFQIQLLYHSSILHIFYFFLLCKQDIFPHNLKHFHIHFEYLHLYFQMYSANESYNFESVTQLDFVNKKPTPFRKASIIPTPFRKGGLRGISFIPPDHFTPPNIPSTR